MCVPKSFDRRDGCAGRSLYEDTSHGPATANRRACRTAQDRHPDHHQRRRDLPKNPLCLGLYNPWTENWYTDTSIRCIYPEMGAVVGHAVTCVYGLPDPNYTGRLSFMDVVDALDAMQRSRQSW